MADRRLDLVRLTWFFDLDDTLHDATRSAFAHSGRAMTDYMVEQLAMSFDEASALRQLYWKRYGATLLGLVRHHGVKAAHFLEVTHRLPGLEERLVTSPHDRAALARLRGRKYVLTNAPRVYAMRVLDFLGLTPLFDGVISIDDMTMFGHHRPKPDARMFRHVLARLKLVPSRCVLVEDTLEHQRSARRLGMRTVWAQRWLPADSMNGRALRHRPLRPAYVDRRVHSFRHLASAFRSAPGAPG